MSDHDNHLIGIDYADKHIRVRYVTPKGEAQSIRLGVVFGDLPFTLAGFGESFEDDESGFYELDVYVLDQFGAKRAFAFLVEEGVLEDSIAELRAFAYAFRENHSPKFKAVIIPNQLHHAALTNRQLEVLV